MIDSVKATTANPTSRTGTAPIRVGFVMHVMQVAGAEILVQRIIKQLAGKIEPIIYCLDQIGTIGSEMQKQGIPVLCLNRSSGIDVKLSGRLAAAVGEHRTQVLHAHQYTPFFYSALARLRGAKTKLLFTEHGRHFPDHVTGRRRFVNRWFLQRFADETNACCEFSAAALREKDGFASVSVIHNGIDVATFEERKPQANPRTLKQSLGLDPDLQYVACIARFHPVKNHALLLSAWQQIQAQNPRARLLLVGDGERRAEMEQLAEKLCVKSSVQFTGVKKNIGELLRAIDVFTLTSQSEASSLTLLEAMASECPIVLTNVGGNPEHIRDKAEGLLVPSNEETPLANAILGLLANDAERSRLGKAARARVMQDFRLHEVVDRYYDLYCKLTK